MYFRPIKKHNYIYLIPVFAFYLPIILTTCTTVSPQTETRLQTLRESIAEEAGPLESVVLPQNGPYVSDYFIQADRLEPAYHFSGVRIMGTIDGTDFRLGAILLLPPQKKPQGTIIAFHGYASYTAFTLSALYRLAEDNWSILAVDLPGHGFSSGRSGDIGDFRQYGVCAADAIAWVKKQKTYDLPKPMVLLGHSTGGTAVLETLWEHPSDIDRAILLAPLIEPKNFGFTSRMAGFFHAFAEAVPLPGPKQGYLGFEEMPFSWVASLSRWKASLATRPVITLPVLVVQGDADKTLDWKSDIKLLKKEIPGATVRILSGRHHSLFDRGETQTETLAVIREYLSVSGSPAQPEAAIK
jgi:lysophospholipase